MKGGGSGGRRGGRGGRERVKDIGRAFRLEQKIEELDGIDPSSIDIQTYSKEGSIKKRKWRWGGENERKETVVTSFFLSLHFPLFFPKAYRDLVEGPCWQRI